MSLKALNNIPLPIKLNSVFLSIVAFSALYEVTVKLLEILVSSVCTLLILENAAAVVNNVATSQSSSSLDATDTNLIKGNIESKEPTSEIIPDSEATSTNTEANKREAVIDLTNNFATAGLLDGVYGPPIDNSYLSTIALNTKLPIPVYGVPNIGANIIYPSPPPERPPIPPLQLTYGFPNTLNTIHGPPKLNYGPPKQIRNKYNVPFIQRPLKISNQQNIHSIKNPKPIYGPPRIRKPYFNKPLKLQYGPPKIQYGLPKENYGPPKETYGPPKDIYGPPKPVYGPPKQVQIQTTTLYIPPVTTGQLFASPVSHTNLNPPPLITQAFGGTKLNILNDTPFPAPLPPPLLQQQPVKHYGPPEPIPHGPPHPGIPAPPTPPDIKYDGWQPIPGLVSRPLTPADNYGVPNIEHHGSNDLQINDDFSPPPSGNGIHALSLQDSYKGNGVVSDSYGAPLNTVTGSGGIVATSGEAHHQQGQSLNIGLDNQISNHQEQHDHQSNVNIGLSAIGLGGDENSLSVIKSVGYELFPNYALGYSGAYSNGEDSYVSPPLNSYSANGPYDASQYNSNSHSHSSSLSSSSFGTAYNSNFGNEIHLPPSGIGLIPPSGLYGIAPATQYGTSLFQSGNHQLNALKINPPRRPVAFREPVPAGLIQSIGNSVAQKDAHGIIDTININSISNAYIPPPVQELTKPVREEPIEPSSLYSLPQIDRPISFQNLVHGSAVAGLQSQFGHGDYNVQTVNNVADAFSSNFGTLEGAYALPLQTSGVNFNVDQQNQNYYSEQSKQINFNQLNTNEYDYNSFSEGYNFQNIAPYQHDCNAHKSQNLPQLNYGVPFSGHSDLQSSHSQSSASVSVNNVENTIGDVTKDDAYGKSFGESFANGGEVIKSQSIDLNNIPLQGALGTYTLQIQTADGLGSSAPSSSSISHEQVLNDGLLQSILAAIEQPQQQVNNNDVTILQAQQDQSQLHPHIVNPTDSIDANRETDLENIRTEEEIQQESVKDIVVVPTDNANITNSEQQTDSSDSLHLIDNNEIALYFSNKSETKETDNNESKVGDNESKDLRNGQQYGSYVSFKTPETSYVYGDLKSSPNKEQMQSTNKEE